MGKMIIEGHEFEPLSLDDALEGRHGQIIQGIMNSLLADDDAVATCFVNTYDFDIADEGWNPEAWHEFLDEREALKERFGADVVDLVVEVCDDFDPRDENTWPDDEIAATFFDHFTRLFGVDREAPEFWEV